jgi:hypothetical protein
VSFQFLRPYPLNAGGESRKFLAGDYATHPMKNSDFNSSDLNLIA